MGFAKRFKAGVEMGVKAKTFHRGAKSAEKDLYKSATKWEKQANKEKKKADKKAK